MEGATPAPGGRLASAEVGTALGTEEGTPGSSQGAREGFTELGQERNLRMTPPGRHVREWDAEGVPGGDRSPGEAQMLEQAGRQFTKNSRFPEGPEPGREEQLTRLGTSGREPFSLQISRPRARQNPGWAQKPASRWAPWKPATGSKEPVAWLSRRVV